ncbi:MAG TPA: nicotinate-nucleotide--dimethylbenzimidazole phosphoribosyltransferase [Gaiellaceae bacterium]|jgi:nicotinate-nucleotide--dimethylbenzimidazole phosphoribosyltransferase
MSETQRLLDLKTKPRGSLGVLEDVAVRIGALQGVAIPAVPEAAVVVAASDHGVAAEGVSAYPQEVTVQMVANFAAGGAAINVLAREAGARLEIVDVGVGRPTANIAVGPAMERDRAERLIADGRGIVQRLRADSIGLIAIGEMGIANTTSAAALCARLLDIAPAAVCGRGTGLDDAGVRHKAVVVGRALEANPPADAIGTLAALGGFEIALLVGIVIGAWEHRVPVVLDGFITGAAALVAVRIEPGAIDAMIASHRSPEPGHALVLDALGLQPLLDLRMRLGEGSGAALALPIVRSSLALLNDMASFEDAGVTDAGR